MPSRIESVETPDGSFDMAVWLPDNGTGPGLLLIQEIFGVSAYIQAVADDLAGLGYVVGAPDLFWRLEPGYQAKHDEAGLKRSLEMVSRFDVAQGVTDAEAALHRLAALEEVEGGIGAIGFCLGGTIAYFHRKCRAGQSPPGTAKVNAVRAASVRATRCDDHPFHGHTSGAGRAPRPFSPATFGA